MVHVEQVDGGKDHDKGRCASNHWVGDEGAEQHQELASESGEARQTDGGEEEESEERCIDGGAHCPATHLGDFAIVRALVADTNEQEESAGDEAVVEHLQDCAVDSLLIEGEDAERHEAHVADGAIRNQFLEVGLHDRHERAVDDGDYGEGDHERRKEVRAIREEWDREANEAVPAELQEHAGEDHRACGGGLHVRVWEPSVEGEHRHLNGEGERECGKPEDLQRWVRNRAPQRQQVECPRPGAGCGLVAEGGGEDRHEHQE